MSGTNQFLNEIEGIVGAENVRSEGLEAYAVDGVTPALVAAPGSVEEVSALLTLADREGLAVSPRGGGTMMGLGEPPSRLDLVLEMGRLNRVIEYAPEDLVVSVEAGMTLAQLQATLGQKRQFLPLDPPLADRCTVGGCIATNASGPSRLRYGSARDLLLGVRLVRADGTVIRGGGKVVKNVAGYDLTRLVIGSLGTLGVIVEATFRLQPLPRVTTLVRAGFDGLRPAMDAVLRLIKSPLQPTALEVLNAPAGQAMSQPHAFELWGRFDALAQATLDRQTADFGRLCRDAGGADVTQVDEWQPAWLRLTELPATLATGDASARLKVSLLPSRVADLGDALDELGASDWPFVAHAGSGIVYLIAAGSPQLANIIGKLREHVQEWGGSLVVEQAPSEIKAHLGTWGPPRSGFPLMRSLKAAFDPNGILNPGRFIGGV